MLTNVNSRSSTKVKYPSFRIDDILNDDFGTRSLRSEFRATNDDERGQRTDRMRALESNALKAASEDESTVDDQPINLSSMEYPKRAENLLNLQFNLQMNENFSESKFKNLKSISSISSSSPTLSVGSSDSPSFPNQLSPTSKSPSIDQLIKCNLNHGAFNELNSGPNHLKGQFPTSLLSLSPCSDETDHSQPNISEHVNLSSPFFNGPQQYPRSAIEDFYLTLNKKQIEDHEANKFELTTFDKPVDSLTEEVSLHNISDVLKKFQQDCKYSNVRIFGKRFFDRTLSSTVVQNDQGDQSNTSDNLWPLFSYRAFSFRFQTKRNS